MFWDLLAFKFLIFFLILLPNLSSNYCKWPYTISCVQLFATPWAVARRAPLSMKFSRQEYWSGLPFTSPGDLPNPGIEPSSPAFQANSLVFEPPGKSQKGPNFLKWSSAIPPHTNENPLQHCLKCIHCKDSCPLDQHVGGAGGSYFGVWTGKDCELGEFGMMRHLQV